MYYGLVEKWLDYVPLLYDEKKSVLQHGQGSNKYWPSDLKFDFLAFLCCQF